MAQHGGRRHVPPVRGRDRRRGPDPATTRCTIGRSMAELKPAGDGPSRRSSARPRLRPALRRTSQRPVVLTGGELSAGAARPAVRPAGQGVPGPVPDESQRRRADRGRLRPPAGAAARPAQPVDRAAGEAGRLPHAAHRHQVPGAVRLPPDLRDQHRARRSWWRRPSCAGSTTRSRWTGPSRAQYEEIFRRCCEERGLAYAATAAAQIYRDFYERLGHRPARLPSARHSGASARHRQLPETRPASSRPELIDAACRSYFLELTPREARQAASRAAAR